MEIIGVLGGVASGKSAVAKMFESLGAYRLDADGAGHAVLAEPEVAVRLTDRWGTAIQDASGRLDRAAIARIVFGPGPAAAAELQFLEAVTHPRIGARLTREIDAARQAGYPAAVLDAAVMLKAGWDRLCSRLVFIEVPRSERERRSRQRGWTAAQFAAREAAQHDLEQKRARADAIIDNSGTLEETLDQVKAVWSTWKVGRE